MEYSDRKPCVIGNVKLLYEQEVERRQVRGSWRWELAAHAVSGTWKQSHYYTTTILLRSIDHRDVPSEMLPRRHYLHHLPLTRVLLLC